MNGALKAGEDVPGGVRLDPEGMVYEMGDGSIKYFMDNGRKYPFTAGASACSLLKGLLVTNTRVNAINADIVQATANPAATLKHGEVLYVEKPTMRSSHGKGTWSDDEYAHPGLQAIYLRLKSFQRFTESWALFERCAAHGVLDPFIRRSTGSGDSEAARPPLRVASLGGGPGYELLAFEWFAHFWAAVGDKPSAEREEWIRSQSYVAAAEKTDEKAEPEKAAETAAAAATVEAVSQSLSEAAVVDVSDGGGGAKTVTTAASGVGLSVAGVLPPMELVSLDLQPSWVSYVHALPGAASSARYSFAQWDVNGGRDAVTTAALGSLDLCIISNVLVYCTDEPTADVLAALLTQHGVKAIMINERGAEQRMVEMLQRRNIVVVRLMDQSGGRDDRQLLVLPPGAQAPAADEQAPASQDARGGAVADGRRAAYGVFPNVPYEEQKYEK